MFVKVCVLSAFVLLAKAEKINYDISDKVIFPSLPNGALRTENTVCKKQSQLYLEHLDNLTLWAHEMWDASAKSTTGILHGSVFQLGNWDECLTLKAPFPTQYCLALVKANVPESNKPEDSLSIFHSPYESVLTRIYKTEDVSQQTRHSVQMGWCVPASCSPIDLENSLNHYLKHLNYPLSDQNVTYTAKISQDACQTAQEMRYFEGRDIAFCLLTIVLVVLVIGGTAYDFIRKKELKDKSSNKSLLHRLTMAFSARKNFNDLPRAEESNYALRILYGMRTFCILMIIMDHRFGTYISGPILNFDFIESQYRAKSAWFIFHGDLFVDSFFILSGILVTYGLLTQFDKKIINPGFIVFLRYIRLTPVYAFVIFYWATIFNHVGAGPMWKIVVSNDSRDCKNNWWLNLLYLSNYIKDDHMCMTHSWYLPCDFHYFIIGIVVCLLIKKQRKFGLGCLLILTIVSVIIPSVITLVHLRPALLQFYPDFLVAPKSHTDFQLTYTKSHTRATPYFIGMFGGYLYYKLKENTKRFSMVKSYVILAVSLLFMFACMVGGAVFYNPYNKYNAVEAAAYSGLHRVAWALGSIGILFVASYGHATVLHRVLSWSPWIPLSKLVYGAYLIHMQFQLRAVGMTANPKYFTYFDVISLSLSDMVLAFASALGLYLLVEAPFRRIFKELLMPPRTSATSPVPETALRESIINNGDCDSRL